MASPPTARPLLPPPEGDPARGHGGWSPAVLDLLLGQQRRCCCLRCALRFGGVRWHEAYQAPLSELRAALGELGIAVPAAAAAAAAEEEEEEDASWCCPVCLGILQDPGGVGDEAVGRIVATIGDRGYDLADGAVGVALGLSVPYCEALRSRACGEWLRAQQEEEEQVTEDHSSKRSPLEVKEIVKSAIERGVGARLGVGCDAARGEIRATVALVHVAADQADYDRAVKVLLPGGQGRAFNRTKKRKRSQGSNSDNLCSQGVVAQLLDACGRDAAVRDGFVRWFATSIMAEEVKQRATLSLTLAREPLYLYGRYQKLSREMPQTVWVVDGGQRLGKSSVEEVVAEPVKQFCGADAAVFMGSGREDMDVRMLGSGRPFLLQVNDPRRVPTTQAEVTALEQEINARTGLNAEGHVVVTRLRLSDKAMVKVMHEGAEAKQKLYTCLVWAKAALTPEALKEKLEAHVDLTVQQKTPVRVLHRRALMCRPKVIHELRCEGLRHERTAQEDAGSAGSDGNDDDTQAAVCSFFTLHLRTSAGTYVKEFVHGDLGRTQPNVGSLLGCEADILWLDVTDVLLPDPDE